MASLPYFVCGPTSILGLIGLFHGPDKTIPSPAENWKLATIDVLIPAYNEEDTIVLCLASIEKQSLHPRRVVLYDDASTDRTIEFARSYAEHIQLNLDIIQRTETQGKTPAIYEIAHTSDADVLAVVDADTILKSERYFERLVEELYQGIGIASACGSVSSLTEHDRTIECQNDHLKDFAKLYPKVSFSPDHTAFQRFQRAITNAYREELYLFLQRFIYQGEMVFFGTLIFPIGCGVVYRREYLKTTLDRFNETLGLNLTTSEDIFLGFAFGNTGYRNIQVSDVHVLTMEPRIFKIYHQIFKWSSSFLQSCFYFDRLFISPFKLPEKLIKKTKYYRESRFKKTEDKRKIKEAYRQSFGIDHTTRYGRNIGWFIFTTTCEKIMYPTILCILVILQKWEILLLTFVAETLFYSLVIAFMNKKQRIRNFFKAILFSFIRYTQIMFDIVVIVTFIKDLWITKNRDWIK